MLEQKKRKQINSYTAGLLKYLRKANGWSQEKCARELGCSRSHYSRLEADQKTLRLHQVIYLARTYNLDLSNFESGLIHNRAADYPEVFGIPSCYSKNAFTNGYISNAFLREFARLMGVRNLRYLLEDEKIKFSYFTNCSNTINFRFILILFRELCQAGHLEKEHDIKTFTKNVFSFLLKNEVITIPVASVSKIYILRFLSVLDIWMNDLNLALEINGSMFDFTVTLTTENHLSPEMIFSDPFIGDSFMKFFGYFMLYATNGRLNCSWKMAVDRQTAVYHLDFL